MMAARFEMPGTAGKGSVSGAVPCARPVSSLLDGAVADSRATPPGAPASGGLFRAAGRSLTRTAGSAFSRDFAVPSDPLPRDQHGTLIVGVLDEGAAFRRVEGDYISACLAGHALPRLDPADRPRDRLAAFGACDSDEMGFKHRGFPFGLLLRPSRCPQGRVKQGRRMAGPCRICGSAGMAGGDGEVRLLPPEVCS